MGNSPDGKHRLVHVLKYILPHCHRGRFETTEKVVFLSHYSHVVTVKLYELGEQYPNS